MDCPTGIDSIQSLDGTGKGNQKAKGLTRRGYVLGEFDISQGERSVGKQYIRQRLAWIVSSKHDVNPLTDGVYWLVDCILEEDVSRLRIRLPLHFD